MQTTQADRQLAAAIAAAHPIDARPARATGNHLAAQNDEPEPEDSLADMFAALEPAPVPVGIKDISSDVRIVRYSSAVCFEGHDDIVIEQRTGGNWLRVRTFNTLSNDYAHTASRDYAHSLANQLLRNPA